MMDDLAEDVRHVSYRSLGPARGDNGRFVAVLTEWERFERHVDRTSTPHSCHRWTGPQTHDGYPRFRTRAGWVRSHRWVYRRAYGRLPETLTVDHVRRRGCTSRLCVRLSHLEAVPNPVNVQRSHDHTTPNGAPHA